MVDTYDRVAKNNVTLVRHNIRQSSRVFQFTGCLFGCCRKRWYFGNGGVVIEIDSLLWAPPGKSQNRATTINDCMLNECDWYYWIEFIEEKKISVMTHTKSEMATKCAKNFHSIWSKKKNNIIHVISNWYIVLDEIEIEKKKKTKTTLFAHFVKVFYF